MERESGLSDCIYITAPHRIGFCGVLLLIIVSESIRFADYWKRKEED